MKIPMAENSRIYKKSRSAIVTVLTAFSIMTIISVGTPLYLICTGRFNNTDNKWVLLFGAIFVTGWVSYLLLNVLKYVFEIHNDRIVCKTLFSVREMPFDNIKGFHVKNEQGIFLHFIPKDNSKPIAVSLTNIDKQEELHEWAKNNFTDLDAVNYQKEMEKIETDIKLGVNKEDRLLTLARSKRWTKVLNIICVGLCLWVGLYPKPFESALLTLLAYPLIVIGIMRYFKGLIKVDSENEKIYSDVGISIFMPGCVVAVRAMLEWHILVLINLLIPVIIVSLTIFAIVYFQLSTKNRKSGTVLLFLFPFLFYGLGAVITINGVFVKGSPKEYTAVIIEKRIGGRDKNNYYIDLDTFDKIKNPNEISVSEEVYNKYKVGDAYPIKVQFGNLGIPWYIKEK